MDLQGPPGVKGDAGNTTNPGQRGRGGEQGRAPSDRGILWFKKYPTFSISQNRETDKCGGKVNHFITCLSHFLYVGNLYTNFACTMVYSYVSSFNLNRLKYPTY